MKIDIQKCMAASLAVLELKKTYELNDLEYLHVVSGAHSGCIGALFEKVGDAIGGPEYKEENKDKKVKARDTAWKEMEAKEVEE